MQVKKRKTYDTRVKYLVQRGLLPDVYRKQIHRSLISKWKREAPDKYYGYELNEDVAELYELMKKVSEDVTLQKTLKHFYRVNKTLKDIIGSGKEYVFKLKEHKYRVVDSIQRSKKTIGVNKGIKLFGISRSTYRTWAMEAYFKCEQSITKMCNNAYPQQLSVPEVHKMHQMLTSEKYLHWPIVSVAYYSMKKSLLKAHPNTWYKYSKLMQIKRKRKRKFIRKYEEGIRATAPNEKWHADITEIKTEDGKISYLYLVVDNFSRYITSWRIADRICGKIRLETFVETINNAGIKEKVSDEIISSIIVDGGTENNNKQVESFIEKYPVEKLIALKDIMKSNSLVESLNKLIKYDYLFPKQIQNQTQLTNYMESFVIPDYNNKRPHGSLNGLTPVEAYRQKKVNFAKIRADMVAAYKRRICHNQTHQCFGCPFGCKTRIKKQSKAP
jgi:putative transposase